MPTPIIAGGSGARTERRFADADKPKRPSRLRVRLPMRSCAERAYEERNE